MRRKSVCIVHLIPVVAVCCYSSCLAFHSTTTSSRENYPHHRCRTAKRRLMSSPSSLVKKPEPISEMEFLNDNDRYNNYQMEKPTEPNDVILSAAIQQQQQPGGIQNDNGMSNQSETMILLSNWIVLGLTTAALVNVWQWLLVHSEWVQAWWYLWPLMGALFVLQGLSEIRTNSSSSSSSSTWLASFSTQGWLPFSTPPTRTNKSISKAEMSTPIISTIVVVPTIFILGGIGLLVGGAYDAWMPVWMTGPNIFTDAGIGHDSAAILFLTSLYAIGSAQAKEVQQNSNNDTTITTTAEATSNNLLLQQAVLLSQLAVLGEGAMYAVASDVAGLMP